MCAEQCLTTGHFRFSQHGAYHVNAGTAQDDTVFFDNMSLWADGHKCAAMQKWCCCDCFTGARISKQRIVHTYRPGCCNVVTDQMDMDHVQVVRVAEPL